MTAVLDVRLASERAGAGTGAVTAARAVRRVAAFDGRTRVAAVRRGSRWAPLRRVRLTASTAGDLWSAGAEELELRRGARRARLPILWLLDWETISR